MLAAAALPVVAVTGVTVAAQLFDQHTYYSLITRYTAVAAPFMAVTIALAVVTLPRRLALAVTALTAASLISGLLVNYSLQTFQPNLHAAVADIAGRYRGGESVVFTGAAAQQWDPGYYVAELGEQRPKAPIVRTPDTAVAVPVSSARVWVVSDVGSAPLVLAALAKGRWHPIYNAAPIPYVSLVLASR
jgi:hypothetical protein